MVDRKIVCEFGSSGDDDSYVVIESFFLKVVDGPPITVSPGCKVRLKFETARFLFSDGKILPAGIPETGVYEVRKCFTIVNGGRWTLVEKGDTIKLSQGEAICLLREFKISLKEVANETKGD